MPKVVLILFFFTFLKVSVEAQTEPEFIGRINYYAAGRSQELEMKEPTEKTKLNAQGIITKVFAKKTTGKAYTYFTFPGVKSPVRLNNKGKVTFIIKVKDNNLDPTKHIVILKMKWDPTKDIRYFEYISKINADEISIVGFPQEVPVPFNSKRFGKSSYIITVESLMSGEYAVYSKDKDAEYCGLFGID